MGITIEDVLAATGACIVAGLIIGILVNIPRLRSYLPAFMQYRHLIITLVSRDLKVKYRRSVLGIVWSILNPLFMMLIITAVFSNLFRITIENFAAYYITGMLIFSFVSEAAMASLTSVLGSASLIKKVYIPKYVFPLQKCLFAFVNMIFSLIAVAIVYLILKIELQPTILLFFIPMLYAAVFAFGLSLILSALNVFFRDIEHLWAVWASAWFYLTPILYTLDLLPDFLQVILKFNPMLYYVGYARDVMMYGTLPGLQENLICAGFSCLFLLIGLLVFKKAQDKFILHI
jgi:ABC-2 type transport system permease protein